MVDDIKPHIIGITESWANNDLTDAELGLEGYAMFRKDRMGRSIIIRVGTNTPSDEYDTYREYRVANTIRIANTLFLRG